MIFVVGILKVIDGTLWGIILSKALLTFIGNHLFVSQFCQVILCLESISDLIYCPVIILLNGIYHYMLHWSWIMLLIVTSILSLWQFLKSTRFFCYLCIYLYHIVYCYHIVPYLLFFLNYLLLVVLSCVNCFFQIYYLPFCFVNADYWVLLHR